MTFGKLFCLIRRHHGPWRRPKGDENRYCRVCGTPVVVKKRKQKIAYG